MLLFSAYSSFSVISVARVLRIAVEIKKNLIFKKRV